MTDFFPNSARNSDNRTDIDQKYWGTDIYFYVVPKVFEITPDVIDTGLSAEQVGEISARFSIISKQVSIFVYLRY